MTASLSTAQSPVVTAEGAHWWGGAGRPPGLGCTIKYWQGTSFGGSFLDGTYHPGNCAGVVSSTQPTIPRTAGDKCFGTLPLAQPPHSTVDSVAKGKPAAQNARHQDITKVPQAPHANNEHQGILDLRAHGGSLEVHHTDILWYPEEFESCTTWNQRERGSNCTLSTLTAVGKPPSYRLRWRFLGVPGMPRKTDLCQFGHAQGLGAGALLASETGDPKGPYSAAVKSQPKV